MRWARKSSFAGCGWRAGHDPLLHSSSLYLPCFQSFLLHQFLSIWTAQHLSNQRSCSGKSIFSLTSAAPQAGLTLSPTATWWVVPLIWYIRQGAAFPSARCNVADKKRAMRPWVSVYCVKPVIGCEQQHYRIWALRTPTNLWFQQRSFFLVNPNNLWAIRAEMLRTKMFKWSLRNLRQMLVWRFHLLIIVFIFIPEIIQIRPWDWEQNLKRVHWKKACPCIFWTRTV